MVADAILSTQIHTI
jgi:hypothetical protein